MQKQNKNVTIGFTSATSTGSEIRIQNLLL